MKRSEEVLLITYQVEMTSPDISVTQARALLDCTAWNISHHNFVYRELPATSQQTVVLVSTSTLGEQLDSRWQVYEAGRSRLRCKSLSFPRSQPTYQPFQCLQ